MRIYIHQTNSDLPYILSSIDEDNVGNNYQILLFNKNLINNVNYFKDLNWFVYLIDYFKFSNKILCLFYFYYKIQLFNNKFINSEIYFFAKQNDFPVFFYLNKNYKNKIFLIDLFESNLKIRNTYFSRVFNIISKRVFDLDLLLLDEKKINIILNNKNSTLLKNIRIKINEKVVSKYNINIHLNTQNNLLFLMSHDGLNSSLTKSTINFSTIKILSILLTFTNYNIVIKQHPNDNTIYNFKNRNKRLIFIEKSIPIEFINIENIQNVIGFDSFSLPFFSNMKITYSVINLLTFINEEKKQFYNDYLLSKSKNIVFLNNFNQLKNL